MLYGLAALINDSIMFINIYALQSRLSEVPLLTRTKFHSAVHCWQQVISVPVAARR